MMKRARLSAQVDREEGQGTVTHVAVTSTATVGHGPRHRPPPLVPGFFLSTCGHGADQHRVEFEDGAEGLFGVRRAQCCLAVALEHQFLVLLLQQHQKVLEEQHVQVWGRRRSRGGTGSTGMRMEPPSWLPGGTSAPWMHHQAREGVPGKLLGLGIKFQHSQYSRHWLVGKVPTYSLVLANAPAEGPFVDHAPRGEVQTLREARGSAEGGLGSGSHPPATRCCRPGAEATLNSAASGLLVLSSEVASRRFW